MVEMYIIKLNYQVDNFSGWSECGNSPLSTAERSSVCTAWSFVLSALTATDNLPNEM